MFALFAHFKSVDLYWVGDYLYADVSIIPNVEKCNGAYCYYYKIRVFSAGAQLTEGTIYLPTISTTLLIPSPPSEGSIVFKLVEVEKATESEEVVDEIEKTAPSKPTPTPTPTPTPMPTMTKQEFIDKINEVGGGKPIDLDKLPKFGSAANRWFYFYAASPPYISYYEFKGGKRHLGVEIHNIDAKNPPSDASDIHFLRGSDAGWVAIQTIDKEWAEARIRELPFATCSLKVKVEGKEVTETEAHKTVDIEYKYAPSNTTLKVISPSYEYVLRKTVSGSGSESFSADEVGTYFIYLQNEDCYVTKELKVRAPPTPTPTPTPTPAPTPTPKCSWFASRMPVKAEDIMDLVRAYLGIIDLGWGVSVADIMGAVAYYHGETESGNNLTGCSL